jgi:hypothetical protein
MACRKESIRTHSGLSRAARGPLVYFSEPLNAQQVVKLVSKHLSHPAGILTHVSAEAMSRLRINAWFNAENKTMTVHFNYNVPLGAENGGQVALLPNVKVSVTLPKLMTDVNSVQLYSPESNSYVPSVPVSSGLTFQLVNGLVEFEIPSLRIYTLAVIQ